MKYPDASIGAVDSVAGTPSYRGATPGSSASGRGSTARSVLRTLPEVEADDDAFR